MTFPLQQHLPTASRLVLSCRGLGANGEQTPLLRRAVQQAEVLLEAALAAGLRLLDQADSDHHGKSQQVLGELFRRQPALRQQFLLQTKCGLVPEEADHCRQYDLSARHLIQSVELSLERLHTDYLDILLLHRPDPLLEPEELLEAWYRLRQAGKVRLLGAVNLSAPQLAWLQQRLPEPPVVLQQEMSLGQRRWLEADLPGHGAGQETLIYCQRHGIQLQAAHSLAQGRFSGGPGALPHTAPICRLLNELATDYHCLPETLVLAWLLRHPAGIQPVVECRQADRLRAFGQAQEIMLSREIWYHLYQTARGRPLP